MHIVEVPRPDSNKSKKGEREGEHILEAEC